MWWNSRAKKGNEITGISFWLAYESRRCISKFSGFVELVQVTTKTAYNGKWPFLCGLRAAGRDHRTLCGRRPKPECVARILTSSTKEYTDSCFTAHPKQPKKGSTIFYRNNFKNLAGMKFIARHSRALWSFFISSTCTRLVAWGKHSS